jgi:hypothetical protein
MLGNYCEISNYTTAPPTDMNEKIPTTVLQQRSSVFCAVHAELIEAVQVRRETEARNDCAGEDQQQFNQPMAKVSEELVGELVI